MFRDYRLLMTCFNPVVNSFRAKEELDLSNNTLTGTIPDTWDETNIISSFKLSHNNITGQLPDTLGRAPNLKRLHVSGNLLTGSIPTSYFNLINLEELYLDGNSFVGGFPQTQEPFYGNIMKLSIHNNDFSGRFPAEYLDPFKLSECIIVDWIWFSKILKQWSNCRARYTLISFPQRSYRFTTTSLRAPSPMKFAHAWTQVEQIELEHWRPIANWFRVIVVQTVIDVWNCF